MGEKTCPRCGEKYSYIKRSRRNGRVYLYAVHYLKHGRERRARYCYLGPEGGHRLNTILSTLRILKEEISRGAELSSEKLKMLEDIQRELRELRGEAD